MENLENKKIYRFKKFLGFLGFLGSLGFLGFLGFVFDNIVFFHFFCFYCFFSFFFVNDTQSINNKDDKRHTLYRGILAAIFIANIVVTQSGYINDKYSAMTILINVAFAIAVIVDTIIGKS